MCLAQVTTRHLLDVRHLPLSLSEARGQSAVPPRSRLAAHDQSAFRRAGWERGQVSPVSGFALVGEGCKNDFLTENVNYSLPCLDFVFLEV